MSRLSPRVNGLLALALAVTLTPLAGISAANASPSAAPNAGQVIVHGVLYAADGSRAGVGEQVTLTAWPTSEVLAKLPDGARVPTLTAGVAVTDGEGAFALHYSDPAALTSYADADGNVDFTVESDAGGVVHSYSLSRTLPSVGDQPGQRLAASAVPESESVALRPLPGSAPSASRAAQNAVNAPVPVCVWIVVATLGNRWVQVGAATTTTGVTATFTYSSGGTATIGVGASVSGKKGTFSASGTTTVTSSSSVTMAPVTGATGKLFRTQYVFKKYAYRCSNGIGDVKFQVRATSFAGGASSLTTTSIPTATYCTSYEAGSSFDTRTTNASAQKWSAGASVASDIGINLSSQSGYTTAVALKFVFTKAHKLCGTNAAPPAAARLVAK